MNTIKWIVQIRIDGQWKAITVPIRDRALAYDVLKTQRQQVGKRNARIRKVRPS